MLAVSGIYGGQDPREVPFYSIGDASRLLRVSPSTLRSWAVGRPYKTKQGTRRWPPLIDAADRDGGRLSFVNLVELHVLSALRGKSVEVRRIREATRFIRGQLGTGHPFADVDTKTDFKHVYVEYMGRLVNTSSPDQILLDVEWRLERIDRDEQGIARRLFPVSREPRREHLPRLIAIDPRRRFGRPMLAGSGIETSIIFDRFLAGDSAPHLADDFGVDETQIEEALRFESLLRNRAA